MPYEVPADIIPNAHIGRERLTDSTVYRVYCSLCASAFRSTPGSTAAKCRCRSVDTDSIIQALDTHLARKPERI